MAPEVCENVDYTERCDVFSLAVIFWQLLTRVTPYAGYQLMAMGICYRVVFGKRLPRIIGIPKVLESILNRMWAQEASERPSSAKLVEIFNDLLSNYTGCVFLFYST